MHYRALLGAIVITATCTGWAAAQKFEPLPPAPLVESSAGATPAAATGVGPPPADNMIGIRYAQASFCPSYPRCDGPKHHRGYAGPCTGVPFGAAVYAHMSTQVHNGLVDQLVLYQYDFVDRAGALAEMLNPRGRQRLGEMAPLLPVFYSHPLVIEASGNRELDEARRRRVIEALADLNVVVSPEMVVVGLPRTPGLDGVESRIIYQNLLRQTSSQGISGNGSAGNTGDNSFPATPLVPVNLRPQ
jgi:hypothetical protein